MDNPKKASRKSFCTSLYISIKPTQCINKLLFCLFMTTSVKNSQSVMHTICAIKYPLNPNNHLAWVSTYSVYSCISSLLPFGFKSSVFNFASPFRSTSFGGSLRLFLTTKVDSIPFTLPLHEVESLPLFLQHKISLNSFLKFELSQP